MKLGKLLPMRPAALGELKDYANGRLPAPPASVPAPVLDWGMDGNDTLGDCTIAGVDHALKTWNAQVPKFPLPTPDTATIEQVYFSLTGGQDTGLVEYNVLNTWRATGLFGSTIVGFAPVNKDKVLDIHQAIAAYGVAYLGIQCPQSAQQDFAEGQPWTYDPSSPIDGGHCIIAVGYDSQYVYCVSWGKTVKVTYPFLAAYLDEAWAMVPHQYLLAGRGPELAVDALVKDLNLLD